MFRVFYIPYVLYCLNCRELVVSCETITLYGKMLEEFLRICARNSNNSYGIVMGQPHCTIYVEFCIKFLFNVCVTDDVVSGNRIDI